MSGVSFQAFAVYGMATSKYLRRLERVEQVLEADGAISLQAVRNADMIVLQFHAVACPTGIAMKKVFLATYSTDATLVAVELSLGEVIVIQMADTTVIRTEAEPTATTRRSCWLFKRTA